LDDAELNRLVRLYNLEDYLFEVVSRRFRESQTLDPYDFFAIVTWKSNRTKTKIMSGLANSGWSVPSLMHEVNAATNPQAKVGALLRVWGIGLALASAILTVCYPEEYTVLDYRAWEVLCESGVEDLPRRYPLTVEEYLQYCRACQRLAADKGVSLRDLDRALWAKSWEDDLLELIGQGG